MSVADNRKLYLAWVRTNMPTVYKNTLRQITGAQGSLGGLADDLTNISFTPDTIDTTGMDVSLDPSVIDAVNSAPTDTSSTGTSGSSSLFSAFLGAAGSVASAVLSSNAQQSLLATNTARAAQGLPPINANGQVVTTTAPASATVANLEATLAGSGGSTMLLLLGAVVVGAILLSRKKS